MILNNITLDGIKIYALSRWSRKKVVKICDSCGNQKKVMFQDLITCRIRHNTDKDYCFPCAMKIYTTGETNPAKRLENRRKISKSSKGKTRTFRDGHYLRILDKKIGTGGYILKWVEHLQIHVPEHRIVMESHINRPLEQGEIIHHIDGDKKNNSLSNLYLTNYSDHSALHKQLETLAMELVKTKHIVFNKELGRYEKNHALTVETMPISLGFEDVALVQHKNICRSRLDTDTKSEVIRGVKLEMPLIASNMSTVCNAKFCIKLHKLGALGVLHRADSPDNILASVRSVAKQCSVVAASIGIESDNFYKQLIKEGCNVLFIDIAHGYSNIVIDLAKKIKAFSSFTKVIIGNTTNIGLLWDTYKFIDGIKVGIGQGFACETKNTAGCTEKQFSAILKFKKEALDFGIPIISDGGLREPADLVKVIAAGASSAMAGKIFAECPESAAKVTYVNGKPKKIYAGMASEYVQTKWKGELKQGTCAEGGVRLLELGEPVDRLLNKWRGALRSGMTYAGASTIQELQKNAEFTRVTSNCVVENGPHGLFK